MFKRLSSLAVLVLLALTPLAKADTVSFSLANPVQSGGPGATLSYVATVSAPTTNAGDLYLNGDTFNVTGPLVLDDSPFLNNFPFFLAPGDSFTGVLFNLGGAVGMSTGTFGLLGGADGSTYNSLGSVAFTAQVTPEPSSLVLLLTGATGGLTLLRRRRGVLTGA